MLLDPEVPHPTTKGSNDDGGNCAIAPGQHFPSPCVTSGRLPRQYLMSSTCDFFDRELLAASVSSECEACGNCASAVRPRSVRYFGQVLVMGGVTLCPTR